MGVVCAFAVKIPKEENYGIEGEVGVVHPIFTGSGVTQIASKRE
jgi:hypothetical protein